MLSSTPARPGLSRDNTEPLNVYRRATSTQMKPTPESMEARAPLRYVDMLLPRLAPTPRKITVTDQAGTPLKPPTSPVAAASRPGVLLPKAQRSIHRVKFKPDGLALAPTWRTILAPAMCDTTFFLSEMKRHILARLSPEAVKDMCKQLTAFKVEARWHVEGPRESNYSIFRRHQATINGASALALQFFAAGDQDAVIRIISARPVEIAEDLYERTPEVFTLETLVAVFKNLLGVITDDSIGWEMSEDRLANAAGNMVAAFLCEHANEQPELICGLLVALMVRLEESGFAPTTANLGVLAGAILAGGLKYCAAIKKHYQDRYYNIDKATLLLWATSAFLPITGPASGALSVIAVVSGVILEALYPIVDLESFITQLEGRLSIRLLKLKVFRSPHEVSLLMNWLHSTILCNGFR